eukprot:scaffold15654_cov66-Phaeocystis_antarctica.AAC.3
MPGSAKPSMDTRFPRNRRGSPPLPRKLIVLRTETPDGNVAVPITRGARCCSSLALRASLVVSVASPELATALALSSHLPLRLDGGGHAAVRDAQCCAVHGIRASRGGAARGVPDPPELHEFTVREPIEQSVRRGDAKRARAVLEVREPHRHDRRSTSCDRLGPVAFGEHAALRLIQLKHRAGRARPFEHAEGDTGVVERDASRGATAG